jgi:paired amphipathic helix protein Sin3a
LPESAAQAKAAAAAKAAEEVAALSNSQTAQAAHGARGEAKMPPVGNFAVPASSSKENKKRPRNNTANLPPPNVLVGESSVRGAMGPAGKVGSKSSLIMMALEIGASIIGFPYCSRMPPVSFEVA